MSHLLIIDDEASICWGLAKLAKTLGHSASTAASAEQGLKAAAQRRPDVIVLDVRLPGMSGLDAMQQFRQALGAVPIIIITAFGDLATAVEAVRNGAFEYLLKPFDLAAVKRVIERAAAVGVAASAGTAVELPPQPPPERDGPIVGHSAAIQEVFKRIALVAPSDACVHICGESGTGKELAARAIHKYSRRSDGPFVAVSVASLSPSLAESELFGHARGAFTGADQARKGLLEQAHGGTIFLDEVAEIPLPLQVKLLRVLEHGEILPVGADKPMQSDFRLISATHQSLSRQVAEGAFRHDLYFRLVTFEIEIPPLRQRREDIPELAAHFLGALSATKACHPERSEGSGRNSEEILRCAQDDFRSYSISDEAMAELQRRDWFGNVRELRNAVEHAVILARGGVIAPEHLPPPAEKGTQLFFDREKRAASPFPDAIATLVRQWAESQLVDPGNVQDIHDRLLKIVEPPLLKAAMDHCQGQCVAAARRLGMHRATLRKKLDELGIGDG
jgi:two-component system, NtrC family, nitrogen regulation response regulator GlnG